MMYTFCFWNKDDFEKEIQKLKEVREKIYKS